MAFSPSENKGVATNQALSRGYLDGGTLGSLLMAFPGTGNKGVTSTEVTTVRDEGALARPGADGRREWWRPRHDTDTCSPSLRRGYRQPPARAPGGPPRSRKG